MPAPRLIPDPLCSIARHNDVDQVAMDLGSVGNRKRTMRNASTFLLIPDPWYVPDKLRTSARDLGSDLTIRYRALYGISHMSV